MPDAERVLFVHAHPDDETIETGGTIATLIRSGAAVTVLTCTRGERGEVIPPEYQGALESPHALAALRTSELSSAMAALGVTDHRFLGAYRDSGMRWGPTGAEPAEEVDDASLAGADFADVAADIASVILDVRPDVVVSYDARGGYGHPDHRRAGEAALRAAQVCDVPFYEIDAHGALAVDITPVLDRKRAALEAYRSQLTIHGDSMVYPGGQRRTIDTVERYSLVDETGSTNNGFTDLHPASRVLACVIGAVIGGAFGGLLTVYHQLTVTIAGKPFWFGAVAAIVIATAILAGFRLAFATRVVAAVTALGMIVVVAVLSFPSSNGSQLIAQNGPGILWEIAPVVLTSVVLVWPQGRRSRPGRIDRQPVKGTRDL